MGELTISVLAFADDLVLLACDPVAAQLQLDLYGDGTVCGNVRGLPSQEARKVMGDAWSRAAGGSRRYEGVFG